VTTVVCPACGGEVGSTDRYCEACGQDLTAPASAVDAATVAAARWVSSAMAAPSCPDCGGTEFGPEGYCEGCGHRRASTADRTELELDGMAALTDRGLRHHRNEDAVGLGATGDRLVALVCDGVSTSTRPDAASTGAVLAALPALLDALGRSLSTVDAIGAATGAAQAAATLMAGADPGSNPPASTFVCAVVAPDAVTVGWVGDSRAYWLPDGDGEPACLTVDDSLAGQAKAHGATLPPGAPAGALVRWLGADATDTAPHLRSVTPAGPGRVLVCSDGLFKYRPGATELAAIAPHASPLETVRALVRFALDSGGADNVSAVVLPFPPTPAQGTPQAPPPTLAEDRRRAPPPPAKEDPHD
jgi:serine/threonine protein phosphatase PrpC